MIRPRSRKPVAALAQPLAEDQSWVEPRCYEADNAEGIGEAFLHRAPDHSLVVETVCWQAGSGVAPHDHQTWGVVVGLDGEEINTMWRRLDDGTREGHARQARGAPPRPELERASEVTLRRGDVIKLLPDDIHSVANRSHTDRRCHCTSTAAISITLRDPSSIRLPTCSDLIRRETSPADAARRTPLLRRIAAVDDEAGAGHETGIIRGQEYDAERDVVGGAEAADRVQALCNIAGCFDIVGPGLCRAGGERLLAHVGVDDAGMNGVDANAITGAAEGNRRRLGEQCHAALRHGVDRIEPVTRSSRRSRRG